MNEWMSEFDLWPLAAAHLNHRKVHRKILQYQFLSTVGRLVARILAWKSGAPRLLTSVVVKRAFHLLRVKTKHCWFQVDFNWKFTDSKPNSDSLSALENEINEALREQSSSAHNDQNYSTFVWICSVSHSKSKVTIVNIRSNPGEVLDSFFLKTHLLCITSVPGAKTTDFLGDSGITIDENSPELKLSQRKEAKESQLKECDAASSSLNSSISFSTVASENPEASNQTSEAGSPIQSDADSKLGKKESSSSKFEFFSPCRRIDQIEIARRSHHCFER